MQIQIMIKSIKQNKIGKKIKRKNDYKLTVRLPKRVHKLLKRENLIKCGYLSITDFVWHSCLVFEKDLADKKNNRNRKNGGSHYQT